MQQTNSKQIGVKRSCSGNNKHSKIGISSQDLERINPDDRQGDGALVRAGKERVLNQQSCADELACVNANKEHGGN